MQVSQSTFSSEFNLPFEGSGFSIQENISRYEVCKWLTFMDKINKT